MRVVDNDMLLTACLKHLTDEPKTLPTLSDNDRPEYSESVQVPDTEAVCVLLFATSC